MYHNAVLNKYVVPLTGTCLLPRRYGRVVDGALTIQTHTHTLWWRLTPLTAAPPTPWARRRCLIDRRAVPPPHSRVLLTCNHPPHSFLLCPCDHSPSLPCKLYVKVKHRLVFSDKVGSDCYINNRHGVWWVIISPPPPNRQVETFPVTLLTLNLKSFVVNLNGEQ